MPKHAEKSADDNDNGSMLQQYQREMSALTGRLQHNPLEQEGPILITKQGLSGPAVLKVSAYGAKILSALSYK